jgi:alanine-alpha-ketoisovalerate/valine-pyruvate aminotransferase
MRLRLVGVNARYLVYCWLKHGMVDNSEDEQSVEVFPKPNSPGADVLYDSYLKRLRAEAREVGVGLMIDDSTPLANERDLHGG